MPPLRGPVRYRDVNLKDEDDLTLMLTAEYEGDLLQIYNLTDRLCKARIKNRFFS